MNQEKLTKVIELLENLECARHIDFKYHLRGQEFTTSDELYKILEDADAFNIEIIYYRSAMQYLIENDDSLNISMKLAQDFGFEPKNINSELLASLLATENARSEFYDLQYEIDEILSEEETEEDETE